MKRADAFDEAAGVEIEEEADFPVAEFEVGEDLGFVERGDFLDGLDFDDEGVVDEQVGRRGRWVGLCR
jgi:hypothetical protein